MPLRSQHTAGAHDGWAIAQSSTRRTGVLALSRAGQGLDVMFVVGGYNSSDTCNLARMCAERVRTFHIVDAACMVSPARCGTAR